MPRQRTGGAIYKWKVKNGRRVKVWYALVYYQKNGKRYQ